MMKKNSTKGYVILGILFVLIDLLAMNNMIAKFIGQVVVIVSNYILSKLWIFKKKKN